MSGRLLAFGDSFTYGFNFDKARERLVWPYLLSSELKYSCENFSAPGASNWRTTRLLNSVDITETDIVVISWTDSSRFEFGVNKDYDPPEIKEGRIGDLIEDEGLYKTKRFFWQLSERTLDSNAKLFNDLAYGQFYNQYWFEEMFLIMLNACYQKLEKSGCKWLMFNAWSVPISKKISAPDQFLFGVDQNMTEIIRKNQNLDYWSKEEHQLISIMLKSKLNEIYGI